MVATGESDADEILQEIQDRYFKGEITFLEAYQLYMQAQGKEPASEPDPEVLKDIRMTWEVLNDESKQRDA